MPLILAGTIIVVFSVGLYYLDKQTRFGSLPSTLKQTIYGLCFGIAAAVATEFGSFNLYGVAMKNLSKAPITPAKMPAHGPKRRPAVIGAASRQLTAVKQKLGALEYIKKPCEKVVNYVKSQLN